MHSGGNRRFNGRGGNGNGHPNPHYHGHQHHQRHQYDRYSNSENNHPNSNYRGHQHQPRHHDRHDEWHNRPAISIHSRGPINNNFHYQGTNPRFHNQQGRHYQPQRVGGNSSVPSLQHRERQFVRDDRRHINRQRRKNTQMGQRPPHQTHQEQQHDICLKPNTTPRQKAIVTDAIKAIVTDTVKANDSQRNNSKRLPSHSRDRDISTAEAKDDTKQAQRLKSNSWYDEMFGEPKQKESTGRSKTSADSNKQVTVVKRSNDAKYIANLHDEPASAEEADLLEVAEAASKEAIEIIEIDDSDDSDEEQFGVNTTPPATSRAIRVDAPKQKESKGRSKEAADSNKQCAATPAFSSSSRGSGSNKKNGGPPIFRAARGINPPTSNKSTTTTNTTTIAEEEGDDTSLLFEGEGGFSASPETSTHEHYNLPSRDLSEVLKVDVDTTSNFCPVEWEIPLFDIDGDQYGTRKVTIKHQEHMPPVDSSPELKIFEGWGLPGANISFVKLCYLQYLIERDPIAVIRSRIESQMRDRHPDVNMQNPGPWLGTSLEGLMYFFASEMPEGMNWFLFLIAVVEMDHGVAASSPMFRNAAHDFQVMRMKEHYSMKMLLYQYVNGMLKSNHLITPGLVPIRKEGRFVTWAIDLFAPSDYIVEENAKHYEQQQANYESQMNNLDEEGTKEVIAQAINKLFESTSREQAADELIRDYGDKVFQEMQLVNGNFQYQSIESLLDDCAKYDAHENDVLGSEGSSGNTSELHEESTSAEEENQLGTLKASKSEDAKDKSMVEVKPIIVEMPKSTVELNANFLQMLDSPDTYIHEDPERPCYFTLGKCDVYSVIINATTTLRLTEFEHAANLLGKILRPRMVLLRHATQVAIERDVKKYVHTDEDEALSKGLWDFSTEKLRRVEKIKHPTRKAAQIATDRFQKGSKWSTNALFSGHVKFLLAKVKNYLVITRVMSKVSYRFLLQSNKACRNKKRVDILEKFRATCESTFRKIIDDLSLAEIHDEYLVQMVQSSDQSVRKISIDVSDVFMKELATNKELIPIYLQGESAPMTVDFQSLSKEEIEAYVAKNSKPYLCEQGEDEKYTCSQHKRRITSRLPFYNLLSKSVGDILCTHKLMNADQAKNLSYGLVCLPASHFVKAEFSFFYDAQLHTGLRDKQYMVDKINGPIAKIFKNMSNAATTFREDRMFVDITKDTKEGSREAEQLFTEYFSYQNPERWRLSSGQEQE